LDETIKDYGYEINANDQEIFSKIDTIRRSILREMRETQFEIKQASHRTESNGSKDSMYEMSCLRTHERWKLGERIKSDTDLHNMWKRVCTPGFAQTQDLFSKMLERVRQIERNEKVVSSRVDRLKSLGNAIVPQVVVPIMQAIKGLT